MGVSVAGAFVGALVAFVVMERALITRDFTVAYVAENGSTKTPAGLVPFPHALLVKVDESERRALEQDARFFHPAYLGPSGWLGLDFTAGEVDWAEVAELLDASFRLVAPGRLIRVLDEA